MHDCATPLITVPYDHDKEVRSVTLPTSKPEQGPIEGSMDKSEPVRRPMNAFMLFRRDSPEVQRAYPPITNGTQYTQAEKSAFASRVWNAMSEQEKAPWALAAEEAKLAHQRKYPDYKYCPRRKERIDRDKEAKKSRGAPVTAGAEKTVATSSAKGKAKSAGGIKKRVRTPPKALLPAPPLLPGYFTTAQGGAHWLHPPIPLSGLSYWPISPCGKFYLVPVPIELLGFPLPAPASPTPSSSPARPEPGPGEVYPSDYLHGFDEHPAVSVVDDVAPVSPDSNTPTSTQELDRDQLIDTNERKHRPEAQTAPSSPELTVSPNDLSRSMSSLSIGRAAPSCSPSNEDMYRQCAGTASDTADSSIERSLPACDDTYLYDWSAHQDSQTLSPPVVALSNLELEKEPSLVFEDWLEMDVVEEVEM